MFARDEIEERDGTDYRRWLIGGGVVLLVLALFNGDDSGDGGGIGDPPCPPGEDC